jgi:hypothetical protein
MKPLLWMVNGVDALNDVLQMGMTNQLDLMEEVQTEVGLPEIDGGE